MLLTRKQLWTAVAVVCGLITVKIGIDLARVLLLEARGALESDSMLYFTVGRGILNGLTPYRDLFESKPPGMFVLTAVSLLVTGDEMFAMALQIAVFIAIPLIFAGVAWHQTKARPQEERWALAFTGTLLGVLLSLYLEERAGGIQTESFGSLACILYMIAAHGLPDRPKRGGIAILSALMMIAIGLKEPFVIAAFAGYLLIARGPRHFLWCFAVPLGIALVTGAILLLITGWFEPYWSTYLPAMFGSKIDVNPFDRVPFRAFSGGRLIENMTVYYSAPGLGWVIGLLWLAAPIVQSRKDIDLRSASWSVATSTFGFLTLGYGLPWLIMWNVWRLGYVLTKPITNMPNWMYATFATAFLALMVVTWKRGRMVDVLRIFGALCAASLVVGIAVYAPNHFAFAVPFYAGLCLLFLYRAPATDTPLWLTMPVIAVTAIAALVYAPSAKHIDELTGRFQYSSLEHAVARKKIDGLLDACEIDRYGGVGTYAFMAFAKHSPMGPLLEKGFFEFLGQDHPLRKETDANILEKAQILVVAKMDDVLKDEIEKRFTEEAPTCAQKFLPVEGVKVLFRKQ